MKSYLIDKNSCDQRFDKYLMRILKEAPSSFIYKMLRKKNITLNGKKATGKEILNPGDEIKIFLADDTFDKFSGNASAGKVSKFIVVDDNIDIIHENDDYMLLNKPSGVLSQKSSPSDISINEMALSYLYNRGQITDESLKLFKPSVANRLDRNTSGLIFFAKTLHGAQYLSRILSDRDLDKRYRCIVAGEVKNSCLIEGFLTKDESKNKVSITAEAVTDEDKPIKTEYFPIKTKGDITLLEVHLITGRSHQIRAHLASINHPIIGDYKYGNKKLNDFYKKQFGVEDQLLHAYSVSLKEDCFIAPLPHVFTEIMGE